MTNTTERAFKFTFLREEKGAIGYTTVKNLARYTDNDRYAKKKKKIKWVLYQMTFFIATWRQWHTVWKSEFCTLKDNLFYIYMKPLIIQSLNQFILCVVHTWCWSIQWRFSLFIFSIREKFIPSNNITLFMGLKKLCWKPQLWNAILIRSKEGRLYTIKRNGTLHANPHIALFIKNSLWSMINF